MQLKVKFDLSHPGLYAIAECTVPDGYMVTAMTLSADDVIVTRQPITMHGLDKMLHTICRLENPDQIDEVEW